MNRTTFMFVVFAIWPIYKLCKVHDRDWGDIARFLVDYRSLDRLAAIFLYVSYTILIFFPGLINESVIPLLEKKNRESLYPLVLILFPTIGFCFVVFQHVLDVELHGTKNDLFQRDYHYKKFYSVVGLGLLVFSLGVLAFYG